ncbi:MAG: chemotaxis protein CheC [Spirochaetota bacterium]|nr:chemotaxis protein CheC [Spirochaetota bacterium]
MEINEKQIDIIKEMLNIGVGRAANVLNTMLKSHVALYVPNVQIINIDMLEKTFQLAKDQSTAGVQIGFEGDFSGLSLIIFPMDSASKIVSEVIQDNVSKTGLNSIQSGTLTEVGNILLNNVIGTFGNMLNTHMRYTLPEYFNGPVTNLIDMQKISSSAMILIAEAKFTIETLQISGEVMLIFEVDSFDLFIEAINSL